MNAPSPRVDRTAPTHARTGNTGGPGSDPDNPDSVVEVRSEVRRRESQRISSTRKYTPTMATTATADGRMSPATNPQAPAQTGRRLIKHNKAPAAAAVNQPSGYPIVR